MGRRSPNLSEAILRRYPNAFKEVTLSSPINLGECDIFFIDILQIVAPLCARGDSVDPETGHATTTYFTRASDTIRRLVNLVNPQSILYFGYDGQSPCMKVAEQRRRTFERLDQQNDQKGSFRDQIPHLPDSETERWKRAVQYAVDNTHWGSLQVIFDWELHPGEAEHKFAAWHRNAIEDGALPRGCNYTIYSGDSELILIGLELHEPHVTIIRPNKFDVCQLVDLDTLRFGIARDFRNTERAIDDFVALTIFQGSDFLPGIAVLQDLCIAYKSVERDDYLVINAEFNPDFLEEFLLSLFSIHSQRESGSTDPELCAKYLRTATWLVKYLSCGVPNWRWMYASRDVPNIGTLVDQAASFDQAFPPERPIPRLANVILKNAMRELHDMPPLIQLVCRHQTIGRFFESKSHGAFDLDLFLRVYENEILPHATEELRSINCEEPALLFTPHTPPGPTGKFGYLPYISSKSSIGPPLSVGERIVYQGLENSFYPGTILRIHDDGTYDIETEDILVPPLEITLGRDRGHWVDVRRTFQFFPQKEGGFQTMYRITDSLRIGPSPFGLQMCRRESDGNHDSVRLTRLGLVQSIPPGERENDKEQVCLTNSAFALIREYCGLCSGIVSAVSKRESLKISPPLFRDESQADKLQSRIFELLTTSHLFECPFVQKTLSRDTIHAIEREMGHIKVINKVRRTGVSRINIIRAMERGQQCQIEWGRLYICLLDGPSFGSVSLVVGWSAIRNIAVIVQKEESPLLSRLGCLEKPRGAEVPLDLLVPLGPSYTQRNQEMERVPSPRPVRQPPPPPVPRVVPLQTSSGTGPPRQGSPIGVPPRQDPPIGGPPRPPKKFTGFH